MMGLSDSERISMIRSAVLIQYTRVTDGRTDGIGVAYTRYSIYAVARKNSLRLLLSHNLRDGTHCEYNEIGSAYGTPIFGQLGGQTADNKLHLQKKNVHSY